MRTSHWFCGSVRTEISGPQFVSNSLTMVKRILKGFRNEIGFETLSTAKIMRQPRCGKCWHPQIRALVCSTLPWTSRNIGGCPPENLDCQHWKRTVKRSSVPLKSFTAHITTPLLQIEFSTICWGLWFRILFKLSRGRVSALQNIVTISV